MAGDSIRRIQSNGIASTIKHYVLNAWESSRNVLDARLDARLGEAALRERYLLAFQIGIERGQPGSVMWGYNRINGNTLRLWRADGDGRRHGARALYCHLYRHARRRGRAAVPGPDGKPVRRLVGFDGGMLAPGETKTVAVGGRSRLIARYDAATRGRHVAGGPVAISVARDAINAGITATACADERRLKP